MQQPTSNITIYSSNYCPFCSRAKKLLKHKGLKYNEIVVDGDQKNYQKMQQLSNRTSVPQIFIGKHHVGGCDELYTFERNGELDKLLAK